MVTAHSLKRIQAWRRLHAASISDALPVTDSGTDGTFTRSDSAVTPDRVALYQVGARGLAVEAQPRPFGRTADKAPPDLLPSSHRRDTEREARDHPIRVAVRAYTFIRSYSRVSPRFHLRKLPLIPPQFVTATVTALLAMIHVEREVRHGGSACVSLSTIYLSLCAPCPRVHR